MLAPESLKCACKAATFQTFTRTERETGEVKNVHAFDDSVEKIYQDFYSTDSLKLTAP